ncbi:MAG TPA: phospholipase D family protein [Rhodocyclaceae bacterium]|nr:phospholipase D family protein [Rhodocyclaceae bacterium]
MPSFCRRPAVLLVLGIGVCSATALPASQVLPARGSVEVAFSPADDPEAVLREVIGAARESVHVQAYVFTSRAIAGALIAAHRRGVQVEVLADAEMNRRGKGKAIPALIEAGIPVAFETRYAAAHNKVLIVDPGRAGCAVVTGSYNFTWSARNRNAENVLVLRDNCAVVATYLENWQRHRADATPVARLPWRP